MDRFKTPLLWLGTAGVASASIAIHEDREPALGFSVLGGSLIVIGIWVAIEVKHHDRHSDD